MMKLIRFAIAVVAVASHTEAARPYPTAVLTVDKLVLNEWKRIEVTTTSNDNLDRWRYVSFHFSFRTLFYNHCTQCETTFSYDGRTYPVIGCRLDGHFRRKNSETEWRWVEQRSCHVEQDFGQYSLFGGGLMMKEISHTGSENKLGLGDYVFGMAPGQKKYPYGSIEIHTSLWLPYYPQPRDTLMWMEDHPRTSSSYTQVGAGNFYVIEWDPTPAPTTSPPTPLPTTPAPTTPAPTTPAPTTPAPTTPAPTTPAPTTPAPTTTPPTPALPPTFPGLNIIPNGERVGFIQPKDFITCQTELLVQRAPSDWAMVLRVGDTWETRVPSVYLTPWSAKIQMRTSTLEHWNYAVTGPQLAMNRRYNVQVFVWGRYHIIVLDGKIVKYELNRAYLRQVKAPHAIFQGDFGGNLKGQMSTVSCSAPGLRPMVNKVVQKNVNLGSNMRCWGTFHITSQPSNYAVIFRMINAENFGWPVAIWVNHNEVLMKIGNKAKPWNAYVCSANIDLTRGPVHLYLSINGLDVVLNAIQKGVQGLCRTTLSAPPFSMTNVNIFEGPDPQYKPFPGINVRDFMCLPVA